MIGNVPRRPGGTDPDSRFQQWVWDMIHALRPQDVSNSATQRTTRGTVTLPTITRVTGTSIPASNVEMFLVKELRDDYLLCHSFNWAGEGLSTVIIAKPPELQYTANPSAAIEGVTVTYTYDPDTSVPKRLAATDFDSEIQIVIPRYKIDGIIFAAKVSPYAVSTPVGKAQYIDLNVGARAWARKYAQT